MMQECSSQKLQPLLCSFDLRNLSSHWFRTTAAAASFQPICPSPHSSYSASGQLCMPQPPIFVMWLTDSWGQRPLFSFPLHCANLHESSLPPCHNPPSSETVAIIPKKNYKVRQGFAPQPLLSVTVHLVRERENAASSRAFQGPPALDPEIKLLIHNWEAPPPLNEQ